MRRIVPALLLSVGCAMPMGLIGCAADGCVLRTNAGPTSPARINHVVFFKLKDPDDAAELIRDCDEKLAIIPGVTSYFAGRHIDVGRPTVDDDYDVGFYVGFDTVEDYMVYVDHPLHVEVVRKWRPRWEWIRVFDIYDDRTPRR